MAELLGRAGQIEARLAAAIPAPRVELDHGNALELLVATILAAQCTDERVNQVTSRLFRRFRRAQDYLDVAPEELEEEVRETGFFRQKARSIRGVMEALVADFAGEVPADMASLTSLPGVGRKTANVVLGAAFGVPGLIVDTHVARVARRLGLTQQQDPARIESELGRLLPEAQWTGFSQRLVLHGRYVCRARRPACDECPLVDLCEHFRTEVATAP
ncbi:MAG: endonuclease III [Gemmatimonadota bacterium]